MQEALGGLCQQDGVGGGAARASTDRQGAVLVRSAV